MTQEVLKLALECAERCEAIDGMYSWSATITAIKDALAQTQEPVQARTVHITWNADGIRTVNGVPDYTHPPQRTEQNFCSRCGKRTADLTVIHTCTPPQD